MKPRKRARYVVSVLLGLVSGLAACRTSRERDELLRSAKPLDLQLSDDSFALRSRDVTVNFAVLAGRPDDRIRLSLFDGAELTLVFERREEFGEGGFAWIGNEEGQPNTTAVFAVRGQALVGTVRTLDGKLYRVRPLRQGIHRLSEMDQKRLPDECPTEGPGVEVRDSDAMDTCASDPPTDIDVLVVYTDDARGGAGSSDAMEATVYLAMAETNETYLNSDVQQRVRLVHVAEVSYAESGNSTTDKIRLKDPSDGFLDGVHNLRDTFAADTVVLITETLQAGIFGEAFIMGTVSNGFEDSAFCVVRRVNATGNFTFGHELGHIMGARHDWAGDATNNSPHEFNHGHSVSTPSDPAVPSWRTVMARNALGGTRQPFWSNPNIDFPIGAAITDPMGKATNPQRTDNHQSLNLTALTVANFRCSSPAASNLWMKDTWNDTGVEPDPLTAAEPMWKSPYIWVRLDPDTTLLHQHQHENPESGDINFIYVKMHNGSAVPASGDLEVYFADASTSLEWPLGWTLIGTIPVAGLAAHATQVLEQTWNPPGAGHFCLLARWVSPADPMTVVEGIDIGANVRNNNNLVWRNVNVIDLSTDQAADASFHVRNWQDLSVPTTLRIGGAGPRRKPSFLAHGELSVRLDEQLLEAWKRGGERGSGFRARGGLLVVGPEGATLENLILPPRSDGRVVIHFGKLVTTPRTVFEVDVTQLSGKIVLGGVSYEIDTQVPVR